MTAMMGTSRRILFSDFEEPWFKQRNHEMSLGAEQHRKLWEHAIVAQVFSHHIGKAAPNILGFGVGREPMAAWFASQYARVLATDLGEAEVSSSWRNDQAMQHAAGLEEIPYEGICSREAFFSRVRFLPVDMRDIPAELRTGKFDMTWSCGSLEHIGGIEAGIEFFVKQMECLRPGGLAVHTTEYNFGSNNGTVDENDLCLFTRDDLELIAHRLQLQGDLLWPLRLHQGESDDDKVILQFPYDGWPHMNLQIHHHVTTSVLLIAKRGSALSQARAKVAS